MSRPLIGVFALQGNVREHVAMLHEVGAEAIGVRRPAELARVDGLVLPGGESTTMYKLARSFELFEPLQKAIADGLPVLGTCAGMIMLADEITGGIEGQETLGGLDVTVRRNAFGRQVDSFEADLSFAVFDTPYHAVFIRAPWVERVGRGVEVLATIDAEHAVAVRRDKLLATSFHPELTGDPRLHGYFTDLVRT
jgi:pyridoxal 5'-phosphate synthase pdxT subunit